MDYVQRHSETHTYTEPHSYTLKHIHKTWHWVTVVGPVGHVGLDGMIWQAIELISSVALDRVGTAVESLRARTGEESVPASGKDSFTHPAKPVQLMGRDMSAQSHPIPTPSFPAQISPVGCRGTALPCSLI